MAERLNYREACSDVANRIERNGTSSLPREARLLRDLARLLSRIERSTSLPSYERDVEEGTVIGLLRAGFRDSPHD